MNEIWAATILENEAGPLLQACVESLLPFVDKWLFIDGGSTDQTLKQLDSFKSDKIMVVHRRYEHEHKGADGRQRNAYLDLIPDGAWVLVIDADEVISDTGYLLREIASMMDQQGGQKVFDVHMVHYFWHLGLVDATQERHYVPRRFFKKQKGMRYSEVEHPVLMGFIGDDGSTVGRIEEVTLHHLSNARGMERLVEKVRVQYAKSNMHSKEQLDEWIRTRLGGTYPVKPSDFEKWPLPRALRKWAP